MTEDREGKRLAEALEEASQLWRWQARLLPVVVAVIGILALAFFTTSFIQLRNLNEQVRFDERSAVQAMLSHADAKTADLEGSDAVAYFEWRAAVLLEDQVVRHRYRQVNATLQLRAWTRQMGFTTGMIMAFVGSLFILSKIRETTTQIEGEAQGLKANLATSSPGIVLAVLGTVLMLVTLAVNTSGTTVDSPVYLDAVGDDRPRSANVPPPDAGPAFDPAQEAAEQKLFDSESDSKEARQ